MAKEVAYGKFHFLGSSEEKNDKEKAVMQKINL